MKKKGLLLTVGATLAMGAIAGFGLKANDGAIAAKAGSAQTRTFYLDCSGFDGFDSASLEPVVFQTWNGSNDLYYSCTWVADNYWYITIDVESSWTGYKFMKAASVAEDHLSVTWPYYQQVWQSLPSDNYYYSVTGETTGSWSAPETEVTISGTHSDESVINETITEYKFDGSGLQTYSRTLSFQQGDVFTASNGTVTADFTKLRSYNGQSANEKGNVVNNGDNKIKVVTPGTYELYVNVVTGSSWLQLNSQSEIEDFASRFLNAMRDDAVCGSTEAQQREYNQSKIDTVWSTWKNEFEKNITSGAQELFTTNNANADVADAATLYAHIVKRYGGSYAWSHVPTPASKIEIYPETTNNNTQNVLVISAIAIAAATVAGGYFFLRRRKEN